MFGSCVAETEESFSRLESPCYSQGMGKSKDPITLAKDLFDEFLSKADPEAKPTPNQRREKAKAAGQLGGLKGGKARAKTLSVKKRRESAKKAALTRWRDARKAG